MLKQFIVKVYCEMVVLLSKLDVDKYISGKIDLV